MINAEEARKITEETNFERSKKVEYHLPKIEEQISYLVNFYAARGYCAFSVDEVIASVRQKYGDDLYGNRSILDEDIVAKRVDQIASSNGFKVEMVGAHKIVSW